MKYAIESRTRHSLDTDTIRRLIKDHPDDAHLHDPEIVYVCCAGHGEKYRRRYACPFCLGFVHKRSHSRAQNGWYFQHNPSESNCCIKIHDFEGEYAYC